MDEARFMSLFWENSQMRRGMPRRHPGDDQRREEEERDVKGKDPSPKRRRGYSHGSGRPPHDSLRFSRTGRARIFTLFEENFFSKVPAGVQALNRTECWMRSYPTWIEPKTSPDARNSTNTIKVNNLRCAATMNASSENLDAAKSSFQSIIRSKMELADLFEEFAPEIMECK